jgi:hypothetical protein
VTAFFRGGERAATTAATWPIDGRLLLLESRRKLTLDLDEDEEEDGADAGVDDDDDDDDGVLLPVVAVVPPVAAVVSDKMSNAPSATPHSASVASSRSMAPSCSSTWRLVTTISSSYSIFLTVNTVADGATWSVTV